MNILVRGTNWVGDAVMSVPALCELRRLFPAARIALHTRSWAEGIFRDAPFIDEIIAFDKTGSKFADAFSQARELKARRFELAVLLPNSFESALVAKLAGVPRRFGYAKEARSFLLTDAVSIPPWKNERHEVFYYLHLIGEIERAYAGAPGVERTVPEPALAVSDERRAAARRFLIGAGFDLDRRVVALGVGSTNSRAKRWPADRYAALNDRLQRELGAQVALVGARDEREVAEEVFEKSAIKPIILTGKTNLAEAVAVLSEIDLLVSNDMGLAHIAPALGTKTLVIFGPTNELTTRPFSENAEIIRRPVECAPCMLRDCPIDHRCMNGIAPEEVFERAATLLI